MATIPTVSPTELIRSSWGNAVATELNTKTVKVDGSMPMTGPLVITASPALKLRRTGDLPYLQFENTTGATRFGYLQGSATQMNYLVDNAAGEHRFVVGTAEIATVDTGGLTLAAGKTLDTTGPVRGTQGRFASTAGTQVAVIDSNGGGDAAAAYVGFYPSATSVDTIGTRAAYVGYNGEGFQVQAAGNTTLQSVSGDVTLEAGDDIFVSPAADIVFQPGGTERFSIRSTAFLAGKAASNLDTAGVELFGIGSGAVGSVRSTTAGASLQNVYCRHMGSADANTQLFVEFTRSNAATRIGSITQDSTTGVKYNTTSDYRLKNDVGPIVDAVDRVRLLRPRRITWIGNPAAGEQDAFLAHEVSAAVPEAVTGVKDAVYPASEDPAAPAAGTIDPQQLDVSRLVPLLTAAVIELADRLDTVEGGM